MRKTLAALLAFSVPAYGQVCQVGSPDETAAIQAAVAGQALVNFEPRTYCVNARQGIRIPADGIERTLRLNGATVGILPGCTQHCKAFETVPGAPLFRLQGPGTIVGDLTPAVGFSLGARCDSAPCEFEGVTFTTWRTDGVWAGGNLGASLTLNRVTIEDFGRNGLSIVNGSRFRIINSVFRNARPGANPGAGIDVEPNPGDRVGDLVILDSVAENCVVGFYLHAGRGQQGYGFKLLNSEARNNTRYGIILNSTAHSAIIDNYVLAPAATEPVAKARRLTDWETEADLAAPVPVGISIGATAAITADDIVAWGNGVFGTPRSAILAGVKDTRVMGNLWSGGSLLTVAPSATVPATAGIQFYVP